MDRPKLETIEHAVDSELESNKKLARQLKLFLCHSYSGMKLREIGDRFSVSESAVTQASRRIRSKTNNDKKLKKLILKIEKNLLLSNV
jgi:chromosomal replication initiation ATPase DnaA